MIHESRDIGEILELEVEFKDADGEYIDPASLGFIVQTPSKYKASYTYGVDFQVKRISYGRYVLNYPVEDIGRHTYKVTSVSPSQVFDGYFDVIYSQIESTGRLGYRVSEASAEVIYSAGNTNVGSLESSGVTAQSSYLGTLIITGTLNDSVTVSTGYSNPNSRYNGQTQDQVTASAATLTGRGQYKSNYQSSQATAQVAAYTPVRKAPVTVLDQTTARAASYTENQIYPIKTPVFNSTVKAKTQAAWSWTGDKVVYDYAGSSVRLKRASDSVQANFGFTSNGYFDRASVDSWRAGAAVYLVYPFDQISGNPGPAAPSDYVFINSDGTLPRFGTTWNSSTGQNTRHATNGASGVSLSTNKYYQLPSSGINVSTNGAEVHVLCSNNARKRAVVSTDKWSPDISQETMWSLGASNTSYWAYRLCGGTALHWTLRHNGSLSSLTTDTGLTTLKANSQRVFSTYLNGATGRRYEHGKLVGEKTDFPSDHTALDNSQFRVGRGAGTDTNYANMLIGAVIVTTGTLTNAERQGIHSRLALLGQQHLIRNNAWFEAQFDELFIAKDVNSGTGIWAGRKGKATIDVSLTGNTQFNVTINATGYSGMNYPSTNANNKWMCQSNYFTDVLTGSMMAVFTSGEAGPGLYDILSLMDDPGANNAQDYNARSLGKDHSAWRMHTMTPNTKDSNGFSRTLGIPDGFALAQPTVKYCPGKTSSGWKAPMSAYANGSATGYGFSTSVAIGDLVTTNLDLPSGASYVVDSVDTTADSMASAAMDAAIPNLNNTVCINIAVQIENSGGVRPSPFLAATTYWMSVSSTNVKTFYPTSADARAGTNKINITDTGSGTHSIKILKIVGMQQATNGICKPQTPEETTYDDGSITGQMLAVGDPVVMIGTFKKPALYNPAQTDLQRQPYMAQNENWLYVAPFNALPAHIDLGIMRTYTGGVSDPSPTMKLQAGYYETSNATGPEQSGGRLLIGFNNSVWDKDTDEALRLNLPLYLETA